MDDKKKLIQDREKNFFSIRADEGIEIEETDFLFLDTWT